MREFANVLGVDDETIRDWESGRATPTFEQAKMLTDLLRLLERELTKA